MKTLRLLGKGPFYVLEHENDMMNPHLVTLVW